MKLKSLALLLMTIAMPAMAEQVSVNSKGISLIPDAPTEESPVVEEEPPKPVIQQKPPTLAKRIRDRLKKIAEDLEIITEDE